MKTFLVIQDVISRDVDPAPAAESLGFELRTFSSGSISHLPERLGPIESELSALSPGQVRIMVFCSLPARRLILRDHPRLASGIFCNERLARWSVTSSLLPRGDLLNPSGILLPYGHIRENAGWIPEILGSSVFIRPDSSTKPFTGFVTETTELATEVGLQASASAIAPEEITLLTRARELPGTEFRFWVVNGEIAAEAAYGWVHERSDVDLGARASDGVRRLAQRTAQRLENIDNMMVVDIVDMADGPKIVELNGFSTSGFYPGLDVMDLLRATFENLA